MLFTATLLSGCGTSTYQGFTQAQLSQACNYVYQRDTRLTSVSQCLGAAQASGYLTRYTLAELKPVCDALIHIQQAMNTPGASLSAIRAFDFRIVNELAHGGPGVIFYRTKPDGAFLPASCARVLNKRLVYTLH